MRIPCPRYHEQRQKIMNSAEILEELETYESLYDYLSIHTGIAVRDPDDVQSIYSTLKAEVSARWNRIDVLRNLKIFADIIKYIIFFF